RIPERNRVLRPEIAHLLADVDKRLALETQETQPMRRDQLLPPEPIFEGNLLPADLPNPYEPVRQEETHGMQEVWNGHKPSSFIAIDNNDPGDEEDQITTPLQGGSQP